MTEHEDESGFDDDAIDPVEVALAAMQGLLASGAYKENPAAAAVEAWNIVPHFFSGLGLYTRLHVGNVNDFQP